MKKETVYLKLERDVKVVNYNVTISDVAGISCTDQTLMAKIKCIKLFQIDVKKSKREIISVIKVVDSIIREFPDAEIQSIGEMECIVEYVGDKKKHKIWDIIKVFFVSLIVFFGAGFAIMTFNEDVSVTDVFENIHTLVFGATPKGSGILEIAYSIGLALGIIIFYNHIGGRRITKDPTPIEVQMRMYENEVNDALVETANRKGELIDVD